MFGKDQSLVFFDTNEIFNANMKDMALNNKAPAQHPTGYAPKLSKQIVELIGDSSSELHRCLLWIYVIEYIIKPKHKPFIEEAPKNKDSYPEKNYYYDVEHIITFPKNFRYNLYNLHTVYDSHFKKWFLQFIENDIGYINLFPYAEDPNDTVLDNIMWAINHFFEDVKNISKYPVVIDKEFGNYSTIESLKQLFNGVNMTSTKVDDPNFSKTLRNMDSYCDTLTSDAWLIKSTDDSTQYYVNLKEYGYIFANAVNEILSLKIFEEYNCAVASYCVMENMAVIKPSFNSDTDQIDIATTKISTSLEKIFVEAEHIEHNPNDMRYKLRDNSKRRESDEGVTMNLSDYNWSINIQELTEMGLTVNDFQHLTIYEFQPDQNISFKRILDSTIGKLDDMVKKANGVGGAMASTGTQKIVNMAAASINVAKNYSTNVSWVDQLLSGYYVAKFDIPYFGNRFIGTNTTDSWSMGNAFADKDFVVNDLTMNVQDIPTWKYNQGQGKELQTTFFLLNKNINDVIRNMKFLFSFAAGAYWIQTSSIGYRPPNLYRIFCPGRFIMLYAAMGIDIEFVGKIRRYSSDDARLMFGNNSDFAPLNVMINQAKSCNIPEAYKISVTFKDLTPGAFNVLAAYFTNTAAGNVDRDKDSGEYVNIFPEINVQVDRKFAGSKSVEDFLVDVGNKITNIFRN